MHSETCASDSEQEHEQTNNLLGVLRVRKRIRNDHLCSEGQFVKLKQSLTCPICLDLFRDPVYIKDCSHRFCKSCIEKHIRLQNKKCCPTCRKKIGTKRELRVDENLKQTLQLVFQDVQKYLKLEEKCIQQELVKQNEAKQKIKETKMIVKNLNYDQMSMTIQLFAKNQLVKQIERNFIRAPVTTTIKELIYIKLNLEQDYAMYFSLYVNEQLQEIEKSLLQINYKHWNQFKDFIVYDQNDFFKWNEEEQNYQERHIYYDMDKFYQSL